MKTSMYALATAAVLCAGCAAAPSEGDLQPQDFAFGASVQAPADQAFFRVDVPTAAFTEMAWPDARDVRLFNAAAEAVPFARVVPRPAKGATRRIALQPYRLTAETGRAGARVEVGASGGAWQVRVAQGPDKSERSEYLLASDEAEARTSIGRLFLSWKDHDQNWQQKVTVASSADLRTWTTVAAVRPVMDLKTTDGQRMTYGEIPFDAPAREPGRYWRLQFEPGFAPVLTSVDAESAPETAPPAGEDIEATLMRTTPEGTEYRLRTPQAITHVTVTPADVNSVLPVQIDARASGDGPWRPLASGVAFRLPAAKSKEQTSAPFPVGTATVQELRVRAVGTTWGPRHPKVQVMRDRVALIVNARGSGPFLLAWGSRAAADSSVPLATLVPGRAAKAPLDFLFGTIESRQVLGGESRLTALAPVERAARWQTALVWVALVGAAGLLGLFAFRVWREFKAGGA